MIVRGCASVLLHFATSAYTERIMLVALVGVWYFPANDTAGGTPPAFLMPTAAGAASDVCWRFSGLFIAVSIDMDTTSLRRRHSFHCCLVPPLVRTAVHGQRQCYGSDPEPGDEHLLLRSGVRRHSSASPPRPQGERMLAIPRTDCFILPCASVHT